MSTALVDSWEKLKVENPKVRIRDAAKSLGVSEGELLFTKRGNGVQPLKQDWVSFLSDTPRLGFVMALTRNESCVHERKGEYKNVSTEGHVGLVVGEDIDLRIFLNRWKYGFYVEENHNKSFQFFDAHGDALHKIFFTDRTNVDEWNQIREKYVVQYIDDPIFQKKEILQKITSYLSAEQEESFLEDWRNLKDTHDFFPMLMKYKVDRLKALRLAEGEFTRQVSNSTVAKVLELCRNEKQDVMIFVGNPGIIQIHTGTVDRLETMGPWFNVMDPLFNLHLRTDLIHESWIVEKPSVDGFVTALELFDSNGEQILQLFGKRKPGIPQSKVWEKIIRGFWRGAEED